MCAHSHTPIALLTDFGTRDWYVGAMKGVILSRCPQATVVDISHEIAPGDITAGAYALSRCWLDFPTGAVFLAVVDPGVGTARRAIAVKSQDRFFVGPDNGLFAFLDSYEAREITNRAFMSDAPSHTFHGRDIFAPTAAQLAASDAFSRIGPTIDTLTALQEPQPIFTNSGAEGCVLRFDHFGNAITNFSRADITAHFSLECIRVVIGETPLPFVKTFGDVSAGSPLAYFGAGDFLEIAINGGSARDALKLEKHNPLKIFP
ncbi:MAG: SAM hydrolase/SAM-dependent halogenase family protein [Puniceicoccales bacterium]